MLFFYQNHPLLVIRSCCFLSKSPAVGYQIMLFFIKITRCWLSDHAVFYQNHRVVHWCPSLQQSKTGIFWTTRRSLPIL
jgi:hypothetical protein